MDKTVCELFAGVGGFRLGLDRLQSGWNTVWFSQWEPKATRQWAHACYVSHFGSSVDAKGNDTTGIDIAKVAKEDIPDHNLLVGGFPCQDYSVAHSLCSEQGIQGKKGVLWWQIYETLKAKHPPFCLFENVDRLLKSPSTQRGRDFGIMLSCFKQLGYSAEWRVVNAATYGAAQRRRRVFIFAYRNDTAFAASQQGLTPESIISRKGFFAGAFPIEGMDIVNSVLLSDKPEKVSDSFRFDFGNAGVMTQEGLFTTRITEFAEEPILLGEILECNVHSQYYIPADQMPKWEYMKGGKKIPRIAANGHEYMYSEGPVAFPDPWNRPGRTMLTSESTKNRSTHVVEDPGTHRLRLLTPREAERLQGFDDDWTATGMPERMRYFCMGNALVVPMITRMGRMLDKVFAKEGSSSQSANQEDGYEKLCKTLEGVARKGYSILLDDRVAILRQDGAGIENDCLLFTADMFHRGGYDILPGKDGCAFYLEPTKEGELPHWIDIIQYQRTRAVDLTCGEAELGEMD